MFVKLIFAPDFEIPSHVMRKSSFQKNSLFKNEMGQILLFQQGTFKKEKDL